MTFVGRDPIPAAPAIGDQRDYVARKPCGCFTVWLSGKLDRGYRIRRIAQLKRQGYEIFPCRTEWARENVRACHCGEQVSLDFGQQEISTDQVEVADGRDANP